MLLAASGEAAAARPACVVDARLVLSRLGLLGLLRLTAEFEVWLPRELREVLRRPRAYMAEPERLLPRVYCAPLRELESGGETEAVCAELAQWDRLPESDDLASLPFFFLGERADDSSLPPGADRGLRSRYEQLAPALDTLQRQSSYDAPRGATVAACIRDAAALAAALQSQRGFILTRLEADAQGAPGLCDYLDAWDVPVTEVVDAGGEAAAPLRAILARAHLACLAWAGIDLAAVHVVLPGFPVLGGADGGLDEDAVARLWQRAHVFWHRV